MPTPPPPADLPWGEILMGLLGGLAVFLFGMAQMTDALKAASGSGMRTLLARLAKNRFSAAATGALVTAVIQSSTVTTVLVVGFLSAGLMTLPQSIGIIFGANVGSTVTAQIVAFQVTQYALAMIAVGFALRLAARREAWVHWGTAVLGLGLVFLGMNLMSDGARPLRTHEPFLAVMRSMESPLLGAATGMAFTTLVHSSATTTGLVIVFAADGFISLEAGIALVLGSNVGTCVTALLAAVGASRAALQGAVVHVLFNVVGVLLWIGFVPELAELVRWITPLPDGLDGEALRNAVTPRQIANAHTTFNLANTLLFIGFTTPIARLLQRTIPEPPEQLPVRPEFLDDIYLATPFLALDRVRLELGRMGRRALRMMKAARHAVTSGSRQDLDAVAAMDDEIDALHAAIVAYLGRLSQKALSKQHSRILSEYLSVADNVENLGDTISTNLVGLGRDRIARGIHVSAGTTRLLDSVYAIVHLAFHRVLEALETGDGDAAREVLDMREELGVRTAEAKDRLLGRLVADEPRRLVTYRLESDVLEQIWRLYSFSKRIARTLLAVSDATAPPAEPTASAAPEPTPTAPPPDPAPPGPAPPE